MTEAWPPVEWSVGLRVDARDKLGGWYEAKVMKVEEGRVRVHFKGVSAPLLLLLRLLSACVC